MSCSGSHEARRARRVRRYTLHSGREDRGDVWAEASKGTAKTQGTRSGSPAVGNWSEDLWKAWRAKLRSYGTGTCRGGHVRDVGLHAQKRGWARGVTWIAGRRRWSRYGEPPRRRNVRDVKTTALGCPGEPCWAVAVPFEASASAQTSPFVFRPPAV